MMSNRLSLLLSILMVAVISLRAHGQELLWNNDDPDGLNALHAFRLINDDSRTMTVVDDVLIESCAWRLQKIVWKTADTDRFDWVGTCDVLVFPDIDGRPGEEARYELNVEATRVATGETFMGFPIYEYTVENLDIILSPGLCWIGLRPVGYNGTQSSWLSSHTVPHDKLIGSEVFHRSRSYEEFTEGHIVYVEYMDVNFRLLGIECPSDFDGDGDVDLDDYAHLAGCLEGPAGDGPDESCTDADLNDSGHVDLRDYAEFSTMFTGS